MCEPTLSWMEEKEEEGGIVNERMGPFFIVTAESRIDGDRCAAVTKSIPQDKMEYRVRTYVQG